MKKTSKIRAIFCFLLFTGFFCHAQESHNIFLQGIAKSAPFGKPFWADMHSTLIRGEIAYATNSPDYDWGENSKARYRPYIFANLGADIPIWSGAFTNGKYGFSLTLPFTIDLWLDKYEPVTKPVINTSYRAGAPETGFIYRLGFPRQVFPYFNIYNWALKLSPYKHESTHIGDELAIYRKEQGLSITRVDVVLDYAEIIFTVNDPDNQARLNHGFKFGVLFNYRAFKDGWYGIAVSEADSTVMEPAQFPFELYAQYQFQSALFLYGFQIIASAEYRLRERYKYPYYHSGTTTDYGSPNLVNCFNFFTGIRYDNQKANYFSKIGIGLRYYYGLNPYGQFRSMPHYTQYGIAVLFE